jgi:hypothetical protein
VSGITEPPVLIVFLLRFTVYEPVVSASGRPVLLLPVIVPFVPTVPSSFKIGPLSALDESLIMAVTSDVSVVVFARDDFFWNVRSDLLDSDLLPPDCAKTRDGAIITIAINNIFKVFIGVIFSFVFLSKHQLKYRSNARMGI